MSAGRARRVSWWLSVVVLTLATLGAAGLGGWQMNVKNKYLPPVADQADERQAAVQAASTGTVKLLSYSPDTLDQDFEAARAYLTGDFLAYYQQFTEQVVRPGALDKHLKTTAHVQRAGIVSLTRDAAQVLVFVDQSTTSKEQPEPTQAASSVQVSLVKVNGTWLINKFTPV